MVADGGQYAAGLQQAVLMHVPFVDVLSTMLDASLPLTVGEYEEWGNPQIKPYYQYMRQYSPYDNIARQAYPAMLVKTSLAERGDVLGTREIRCQVARDEDRHQPAAAGHQYGCGP